MTELVTTAWREERIPPEWSMGELVSIHKKEDRLDCKNYRGICLLSTGYKLFAKILCARLHIEYKILFAKILCARLVYKFYKHCWKLSSRF